MPHQKTSTLHYLQPYSNMCLYFLKNYIIEKEIPRELIDVNIASDYSKLANMLNVCITENKVDIITKSLIGEPIEGRIIQKFNPEIGFGETELISMLYYMGYLTISKESIEDTLLKIPNKVMKDLYGEYFLQALTEQANLNIEQTEYNEILKEIS